MLVVVAAFRQQGQQLVGIRRARPMLPVADSALKPSSSSSLQNPFDQKIDCVFENPQSNGKDWSEHIPLQKYFRFASDLHICVHLAPGGLLGVAAGAALSAPFHCR
jgi:hypothetical protein